MTQFRINWLAGCWLGVGLLLLLAGVLFPPTITLQWETASETDSAGFHIFRTTAEAVPPIRLTESLVASAGSSSAGARYAFRDGSVQRGQTYTYFLEEVSLSGTAVSHTAFQQTHRVRHVEPFGWVGVGLVVGGLFLLFEKGKK